MCIRGFRDYCESNRRVVHALSIMPDHAHLVIRACGLDHQDLGAQLKGRATQHLNRAGLHPFGDVWLRQNRHPSPWAHKCWSVWLRSPRDIARAVKYVEQNPIKDRLKPQRYDWVVPHITP